MFDFGDEEVQSASSYVHSKPLIQSIFLMVCTSPKIIEDLRGMPQPSFMESARVMFRSFLNCIEGLQVQNGVIVEVLEAIRYCTPKIHLQNI